MKTWSSWQDPYRLVVGTSLSGGDSPGSTPGEDILATGASNVILALAYLPGPRASQKRPSGLLAFSMDHLPSMPQGQNISGLVVEHIIAIDVTRVRLLAVAFS